MTGYESKKAMAQDKLAQPAQEPVAWPCVIAEADFSENTVTLAMQCTDYKVSAGKHWLSTTPPQRPWVGLTDEQIEDIAAQTMFPINFARAIEAAHGIKEKNNG